MKLFKDAEHAIRDASWCSVDHERPYAVLYSPAGFYVSELSKVTLTDNIAEVIHESATIRFPDSSPDYKGGASRRLAESARADEAISKIKRGDSL